MKSVLFVLTLLGFIGQVQAAPVVSNVSSAESYNATDAKAVALIKAKLAAARPDLPVLAVHPSEVPGFYDVVLPGAQVLHITADGSHFFTGDLYSVSEQDGLLNISETGRNKERKRLIAAVDEKDMLIFAPPKEQIKSTITVFTDIDCVYCRKLHKEVPELNRLGIAVRYLAYPRAGLNSPSYDKLVSAWCSKNPKIALTRAKNEQKIEHLTCDNPVAAEYALGERVGVNSTPSIVYEDGTLAPGYLPAEKLAAELGVL